MSFYLAGKWSDKENIIRKINQLTDLGLKCSHNWTQNESKTRDDTDLGHFAQLDINGVKNSDYYIAYMNDSEYQYRGTYTELGCALGLNKKTFIVYEYPLNQKDGSRSNANRNCFFYHPDIQRFDNWDTFIEEFKTIIQH